MVDKITDCLKKSLGGNFILHNSITNWGGSVLVMERSGIAFARTYWFNDNDHIYFDWLSIDEVNRNNGIATKLLNAHIDISKQLGVNSYLWVEDNTWIKDWYIRNGYTYHSKHQTEPNSIWMVLDKNNHVNKK